MSINNSTAHNPYAKKVASFAEKTSTDKILNQLSLQTLGRVKQLYMEMTIYPEQVSYNYQGDKTDPRQIAFQKEMRTSVDGLMKVLIWRLDGAITETEFT